MNFANLRIGIGHDTHRLVDGGPLLLGGVSIPFEKKLHGHSDADVLLHAITDAILGAAGLGDIGEMFPDTADENKGRNSSEMLQLAYAKVQSAGYQVVNLDCIVFAQRPKLSQYKSAISASIAKALGMDEQQVNVKAKTGEGIGEVGNEKCMMAQAIALLCREAADG